MRAVRYHAPGDVRVEDIPEPEVRPGTVRIRVLGVFVSPSTKRFLMGAPIPGYPLPPPPFTPGANTLGVIDAVGAGVEGLEEGERVYCDPFVSAPNVTGPAAGAFVGYFGFAANTAGLLAQWPNGGFAEKALFPAGCVTPLETASCVEAPLLVRLGHFGTAYEAMRRGGYVAGGRVIVTGATGILGVCTVMLALAMGASTVYALGRRTDVLARLVGLEPKRVMAVEANGTAEEEVRILESCGGADILVECLGPGADTTMVRQAILALRRGGEAVLVGGPSGDLRLSYSDYLSRDLVVRGSAWFPRWVPRELLRLIGSGAIDMTPVRARRFGIDQIHAAMDAAIAPDRAAGFEHVALVP
jgi:alcohol dehydrogenase